MSATDWVVWQNGFRWGFSAGLLVGCVFLGGIWWLRKESR